MDSLYEGLIFKICMSTIDRFTQPDRQAGVKKRRTDVTYSAGTNQNVIEIVASSKRAA
jgi:hypothetical protein